MMLLLLIHIILIIIIIINIIIIVINIIIGNWPSHFKKIGLKLFIRKIEKK